MLKMASTFVSTMTTPPILICTLLLSQVVQCLAFSNLKFSKAALLWMEAPSGTSTSTQPSNSVLKKLTHLSKLLLTCWFVALFQDPNKLTQKMRFKMLLTAWTSINIGPVTTIFKLNSALSPVWMCATTSKSLIICVLSMVLTLMVRPLGVYRKVDALMRRLCSKLDKKRSFLLSNFGMQAKKSKLNSPSFQITFIPYLRLFK